METKHNIFEALRRAMTVGSSDTSMQSPDLDETVLDRALAGQATEQEVVLRLYKSANEYQAYSVGKLLTATMEDGVYWELASGESLWTM
jgi:hypothetical protein